MRSSVDTLFLLDDELGEPTFGGSDTGSKVAHGITRCDPCANEGSLKQCADSAVTSSSPNRGEVQHNLESERELTHNTVCLGFSSVEDLMDMEGELSNSSTRDT